MEGQFIQQNNKLNKKETRKYIIILNIKIKENKLMSSPGRERKIPQQIKLLQCQLSMLIVCERGK